MSTAQPNLLRYSSSDDPLTSGAWQVSTWDAGQSNSLKWSADHVKWDSTSRTLNFKLTDDGADPRKHLSGEVQSVASASTGTWSWTAEVPELVSGSVFGLFTYKANYYRDRWIEFDFEFLGKDAVPTGTAGDVYLNQVRLNIHMQSTKGGQTTTLEKNLLLLGEDNIFTLPFDVTEGFHTYEVTVTSTNATFNVYQETISADPSAPPQYKLVFSETFGQADMGGVWFTAEMKSFINLWNIDNSSKEVTDWAGLWTYPGDQHVLEAKVKAAAYKPLDGTTYTLIGGTGSTSGGSSTDQPKNLVGGTGNDTLAGGSGNDTLSGFAGSDILKGEGGADALIGGLGQDQMYGGTGADTFKFLAVTDSVSGNSRDVIHDFQRETDRIDLSAIDANTKNSPVDDPFSATLGSKAAPNTVWVTYSRNDAIVWADVDGNTIADFSVRLAGVTSGLTIDNFVL